jgi:LAS superfamily LD-carboxypeptidase LdcB
LQNSKYEPSDLTEITWDHIIIKTQRPYLRDVAANALKEMSQQFYDDMWHNIYLLSAYRSYKDQEKLRNEWCSTLKCAKNWWSEHQLWLAVDIHVANSQWWYSQFNSWYLDWMNENAYKYWFINTYRKWPKIDGKMNEIRHWRYVWVPFATELHEKDMSFAERVNSREK